MVVCVSSSSRSSGSLFVIYTLDLMPTKIIFSPSKKNVYQSLPIIISQSHTFFPIVETLHKPSLDHQEFLPLNRVVL